MPTDLTTASLLTAPEVIAPDGSRVRILPALSRGSLAHFELGPGETSTAVSHRTVEELWYCLGGLGQMWRLRGVREEVVDLRPGVALTIPVGTHFQFRATGSDPLTVVAVTMPPWPGDGEAVVVEGKWSPTVSDS